MCMGRRIKIDNKHVIPNGGSSWTTEDKADLSKELSFIHGGKDDTAILADNFHCPTIDEEHLKS